MKKIKIKDISTTGSLETIINVFGQTSENGITKFPYADLRRFASNLLPIVESEWELGYIDASGNLINTNQYIRMKNYLPINTGRKYLINDLIGGAFVFRFYNSGGELLSATSYSRSSGMSLDLVLTPPTNAAFYKMYLYKGTPLTPRSIYDFGMFMIML